MITRLKIVFLLILSLTLSGCRKPTAYEIIQAAQWSVDEACSTEYLNEGECGYAKLVFDEIITNNVPKPNVTPDEQRMIIGGAFKIVADRLPADNKVKPYFQWVVTFLDIK